MEKQFVSLFDEKIIAVGMKAGNADDAIRKLGRLMDAAGFVTEDYADDVIARERDFPTGLPTQPISVAIPHADPDNVNIDSIAIAVLKDPVDFVQMGSNGKIQLSVSIVFMLALQDFKRQTAVIRDLIAMIQNKELIQKIKNSSTPKAIYKAITLESQRK